MAHTILLKRSAVAGKIPQISDLELGELAVNTCDGTLIFRKRDESGADSLVSLADGLTGPAGAPGVKGDTGLTGATGLTGPAGAPASLYVHYQAIPESVWNIAHALGRIPQITVLDSAGSPVEGGYAYPDNSRVVLTFSAAFSGTAYLS